MKIETRGEGILTVVTDDWPDNTASPRNGRRSVLIFASALAALGAGLLCSVLVWQPAADAPRQRALFQLAYEAWPLFVLAAAALFGYEMYLHRRLVAELVRFAGPRIVEALQPQETLRSFLINIYGPNDAIRDVVAGVLGGEGLQPGGADLTISRHTTVNYDLQSVDDETYHLTSTVSYSFRQNVAANRVAIFATCDPLLRDTIISGCRLPLFELWFVSDPALFQRAIDDMLPSVRIGISYLDSHGKRQEVEPGPVQLSDVKFDRWPEYLTFFREAMGPMPKQNPRHYLSALRIFECDLSGVTEDKNRLNSIDKLMLRSTTRLPVNDGYCYWQAPFPCYVDRITLNAKELKPVDDRPWEFQVVTFAFRSTPGAARWRPVEELHEVDINTWLLPGHGTTLLWRPSNQHQ